MGRKVSQPTSTDEKESKQDNPLVSIITPVFNGIKYLEHCIQSVLNQSYPYIEHILVDGGSTDGTLDMLSSYQDKHPDRIKFISEPDKGAGEAANKGWRMAKGEIFGLLGSDDVYEPEAIMTVVEFFRANPDAYFVFGDCNVINEKGEVIGKSPAKDFDLAAAINDSCCLPFTSAFYKREVIEKVGPWDTSLYANDLDYAIRVGKTFKIHWIKRVLSNFRIHKDSVSGSEGINKIYRREHFKVIRRHGGQIHSFYGIRYFTLEVVDWLRPVLGSIYPSAYNVYDALRRRIKLMDMLLGKIFPRGK